MVFASDHRTPRENKVFCNPISCGEGLPFPISAALLGNIGDVGRFRNGRHCLSGLSLVDLRKGELLSAAEVTKIIFSVIFAACHISEFRSLKIHSAPNVNINLILSKNLTYRTTEEKVREK
ncbi:hypothetical protein AVEN_189054-1 [Araneus ventricosus]|uniref:Uncharacterized protein n=1 Tax=Araneus ventricosus TaxID=182803 RepID=A0A4Y2JLD8_ARAVE|nr:hypothetical protein AVEN_189054-1 [Araneus ventricosus]